MLPLLADAGAGGQGCSRGDSCSPPLQGRGWGWGLTTGLAFVATPHPYPSPEGEGLSAEQRYVERDAFGTACRDLEHRGFVAEVAVIALRIGDAVPRLDTDIGGARLGPDA